MHHGMGGMMCPICGAMVEHHMAGHHLAGHQTGGMMGGKGMMKPWKLMMIGEKLGLSEDQRNRMREIMTSSKKKKIGLKCQIETIKVDLMSMMWQEQMNMQEIEQKVREVANLKADKKIAWIQAMNDMKNVLTPEQRQEMKEMMMGWWKKGGMGGEPTEMEEEEEESEEEESED